MQPDDGWSVEGEVLAGEVGWLVWPLPGAAGKGFESGREGAHPRMDAAPADGWFDPLEHAAVGENSRRASHDGGARLEGSGRQAAWHGALPSLERHAL